MASLNEPVPAADDVLYVVSSRDGYTVRFGSTVGSVLSRHSTLQQAVDAAKKRAAPLRGGVVWWDLGGQKSATYGAQIDDVAKAEGDSLA